MTDTIHLMVRMMDERRIERGLSKRDLSLKAGLAHGTFWHVSKKPEGITLGTAIALCEVLDFTLQVSVLRDVFGDDITDREIGAAA